MAKTSNFRIGIFVLSALVLAAVMLYFLGMSDFFVRKAKISTFFAESVQGLSAGAQVKYKGAPIGTVEKIVILPYRKIIQVDMNVELDSFRNDGGSPLFESDDAFYGFLEKEVQAGLRCRLEFAGITGLRYLDLDYFGKPGEALPAADVAVEGYAVPSVGSTFSDVVKSLTVSLERISRIRFDAISDKLVGNLNDLNTILTSDNVRNTLAHLNGMAVKLDSTAGVVSQVITEDRLRQIVNDLEGSLKELRVLSEVLRKEAEKSDIAGTASSVRDAADSVSGLVREEKPDLKASVDAWIRTLDMLRELLDNINQDPASVIRGRK